MGQAALLRLAGSLHLFGPAFRRGGGRRTQVKKAITAITAAAVIAFAAAATTVGTRASSHREALAILNDPCVDNTDVYAW